MSTYTLLLYWLWDCNEPSQQVSSRKKRCSLFVFMDWLFSQGGDRKKAVCLCVLCSLTVRSQEAAAKSRVQPFPALLLCYLICFNFQQHRVWAVVDCVYRAKISVYGFLSAVNCLSVWLFALSHVICCWPFQTLLKQLFRCSHAINNRSPLLWLVLRWKSAYFLIFTALKKRTLLL